MRRSDFLQFGGLTASDKIEQQQTYDYLVSLGFGNGELHQAREAILNEQDTDQLDMPGAGKACDFCFTRLMGGEYEKLRDGRERCIRCSRTKLATEEQFVYEYERVVRNMELIFGISIPPVREVQMVNAKQIAKNTNEEFSPTSGVDARVLGYATNSAKGSSLFIENGSPRMAAISTMAHELTHIWQYSAWEISDIEKHYGKKYVSLIYEGMAMWTQIQYLIAIKEFDFARDLMKETIHRQDIYGIGFNTYASQYSLQMDGEVGFDSPFHSDKPLGS